MGIRHTHSQPTLLRRCTKGLYLKSHTHTHAQNMSLLWSMTRRGSQGCQTSCCRNTQWDKPKHANVSVDALEQTNQKKHVFVRVCVFYLIKRCDLRRRNQWNPAPIPPQTGALSSEGQKQRVNGEKRGCKRASELNLSLRKTGLTRNQLNTGKNTFKHCCLLAKPWGEGEGVGSPTVSD